MRTMFSAVTTTLGIAVFAATFTPNATAGCGDTSGRPSASILRQPGLYLIQAAYEPQSFVRVSDHDNNDAPIVGMWKVTFLSKNNLSHNPPIPDGAPIDFGYSQWHSDGTEFLNSGQRAPATQNFCLGVWKRIGYNLYKLNHFALSYDATGKLNGNVNIREQVTLDHTGNSYTGPFTIDVFDPVSGNHVDHVEGIINGTRITAD